MDGWKEASGAAVLAVERGELEQRRERPLKEVRASWSLKWREAVAAAWGRSGLQPSAEALKHFSLSLCFSQPKRTPAPLSARLTVTRADLSVCVCVCVCVRKKKA